MLWMMISATPVGRIQVAKSHPVNEQNQVRRLFDVPRFAQADIIGPCLAGLRYLVAPIAAAPQPGHRNSFDGDFKSYCNLSNLSADGLSSFSTACINCSNRPALRQFFRHDLWLSVVISPASA